MDVGSFAGAARRIGRATSVISYSISNLEAQLGVLLFDRKSTRKPQLTEAGRGVLSEVRTITNGVNLLRAKQAGHITEASKAEPAPHRVINLMDALRASIGADIKKKPAAASTKARAPARTTAKRKTGR